MEPDLPDQLHILILDDDPNMRELLVQILSPGGHILIPVSSAEEALEQLPYFTFQVAFLDHQLPNMEGMVLGEYLRKNNPHMEIALVTGHQEARLARVSEEHRITLISKPFQVEEILDVVSAYKSAAQERHLERLKRSDKNFAPLLQDYLEGLPESFDIPSVPGRIEEKILKTTRDALRNLRSVQRYNEKDRVTAFSGLLAARLLGIKVPKNGQGETLYEAFDACMELHGRRREFS